MKKLLILLLLFTSSTSFAAAPMVKTSAPGYYRFMLGDFEITALSDGTAIWPMKKLLTNTTPANVKSALAKSFIPGETETETSVNSYLINTGAKLILVDAGAAGLFGPTLGKLLLNLAASGYKPEQIDEIYITHLHNDHVGGLLNNGKPAFANAIIRVDQRDMDFWLSKENLNKASEENKGYFQGPTVSLTPYLKANRVKSFDGDTELVPGISAVSTRGHTAGHSGFLVESKGRKLMLWGDIIHFGALQFDVPSVTIKFDTDSKAAIVQRKKAFAQAAKERFLVGASHIPFPGLGHVRLDGKRYVWVPMNYGVMP